VDHKIAPSRLRNVTDVVKKAQKKGDFSPFEHPFLTEHELAGHDL